MEIKKTNLKVTDRMELNPIDVNSINEPKKLLGMTPKFKTMYFDFEEGKGLPDHVHNGYASMKVKFKYHLKVEKNLNLTRVDI